jgi:peptidoglycan/LPS O-acetylase OafA/YrhL
MTVPLQKQPRLRYIDNIRILLICLVITTHTAITFGAQGSWYYTVPDADPVAGVVLTVVTALNQAFFMGFFFLISAYFVPGSFDRKGTRRYLSDRMIRLGIPLVVWVLVISPLLDYVVASRVYGYAGSFTDFYPGHFVPFHGFGLGPMWFVFTLLLFDAGYAAWREARRDAPRGGDPRPAPRPGFAAIVLFGLALGIVTFAVRVIFPVGTEWDLFAIQIPFYPQYIALFLVGLSAARNDWLSSIPAGTGKACGVAALVLAASGPPLLLAAAGGTLDPLLGGVHWQALLFAAWEQVTGIMIIAGLLWLFSTRLDTQGPVARGAAADTYTVYLIHAPVLLLVSFAIGSLPLPTLQAFALVLGLAIALSFGLAHLIRAIPGAKAVL